MILNGRHPSQREFQEILVLLVQAGADIYAVENNNYSVSECALQSNRWLLWEAVLRDCAKDVVSLVRAQVIEKGLALLAEKLSTTFPNLDYPSRD